ncbi:hypothetical protein [Noviherbaspirillum galbum]|uniref:Uncharacterized protein n=1 Tax=Noviherbaspirillum galbum TaxID=2709383 RepID=A0A6B3SM30_9BURK|nr:hypothetical protein [Noviherbaspirillum galbum]NEX61870.1 hypothetical protein [Noviherbaspirillum galbum]
MIKFAYILYGAIVVLLTTCTNLSYLTSQPGSSSNWGTRSGSPSYGGGGGSYSGGHK